MHAITDKYIYKWDLNSKDKPLMLGLKSVKPDLYILLHSIHWKIHGLSQVLVWHWKFHFGIYWDILMGVCRRSKPIRDSRPYEGGISCHNTLKDEELQAAGIYNVPFL